MSVELGKINGPFFLMDVAGNAHSNIGILNFSFSAGRYYLLHNNKWKRSPSLGAGIIE
jgi:hypothetical protein